MTETATTAAVRVPVGDPVYNELTQFLYEEASLLDQGRLHEWLELLTEDLDYRAPVRQTVQRADGAGFSDRNYHFLEDRGSLTGRVYRLIGTSSAWAEDPPSRCRRMVTNLLVNRTDSPDEFACAHNLLVVRHRFNDSAPDVIAAERRDLLRRTEQGWRLARRTVLLNETLLSTPNLAIFL
ncbi:aromatic-ring-hydroxylating dioxygenase subunit beta [Streptomyces sp. bgisy027]|uniref:aromatic-ring-hydroxylating dioxygenase subunit beta n=1 Tax=unclassified Streptomyces TaxID=2593676 RepID=UPI003D711397